MRLVTRKAVRPVAAGGRREPALGLGAAAGAPAPRSVTTDGKLSRPPPPGVPAREPRREPAAPPRPRPQPRPARRQSRPRVAGGVLWIVIVAALLAGIVALNVAVLRLNMQVEHLDNQRDELVSSARTTCPPSCRRRRPPGASSEIARSKLHLGAPASTTYLELGTAAPRR